MSTDSFDFLDDLFHGCAFAAFVEQAALQQASPHPELTRRRAYALYEESLAEKARQPITLTDLLADCDFAQPLLAEDRSWLDAPAVGGEVI